MDGSIFGCHGGSFFGCHFEVPSDKAELVREAIEKILYPFQPKADLGNFLIDDSLFA